MEESSGSTQPLFDITGMNAADAKDYLFSLAAHLKQVEAEILRLKQEQSVWQERSALAERQGQPDLKAQAVDRANMLAATLAERDGEARQFRAGIDHLKQQLQLLPLTERTVNTDALLDSLTQLAGPPDPVTPATKRAEADEALAALKKRLSEGS